MAGGKGPGGPLRGPGGTILEFVQTSGTPTPNPASGSGKVGGTTASGTAGTSGNSASGSGQVGTTKAGGAAGSGPDPTTASPTLGSTTGGGTSSSSPALVSPAFFVSPGGSDSNPGTQAQPFATPAAAQSAMRNSSTKTTYLHGGTYVFAAQMHLTSADAGTTWLAYPGETVATDGGGSIVDLWYLDTTSGITIRGIGAQNCEKSGFHLFGYSQSLTDGTTGCTLDSCTVNNVTGDVSGGAGATGGILLSFQAAGNTVTRCTVTNTCGPSITLAAGSSDERIDNNTFTYCVFDNANLAGATDTGMVYIVDRGKTATRTILVDHCQFGNVSASAKPQDNSRHLYCDDLASHVTATNNIFHGNAMFAWMIHGGDYITIQNNIFNLDNITWGALYQEDVSSGFPNYGTSSEPYMGSNSINRNIYWTSVAYTESTMISVLPGSQTIVNPNVFNNLYFSTTGATLPYNQGAGADSSPQVGDPKFASPANDNYALGSGSAASSIGFQAISFA